MSRLRASTLWRTALAQRVGVREVADANAAARDLVLVGRADAARGRADLALAAPRLAQQIQLAVIRQDQVRLVADDQPIADRRCRRVASSSISANSACGSTTTPLPMTQVMPVVQDARTAAAAARTSVRWRRPCGRRCARPDSARRWKSSASGDRRSCLCLRRPTARPERLCSYVISPAVFYLQSMIHLDGNSLTLEQLRGDRRRPRAGRARRRAPRAPSTPRAPSSIATPAGDTPVYGINTGFGSLAEVKIPASALGALQRNLLRSHAAGVGEPLPVARGARDDGAARQRAGQGLFRHPARDARSADRGAQRARASGRAEPRLGRRERRSRAARASRARADRRRAAPRSATTPRCSTAPRRSRAPASRRSSWRPRKDSR